MNKKEYKQPSLKVVQLDNTDLICTSPGGPSPMRVINEEPDEYLGSDPKPSGWGIQW